MTTMQRRTREASESNDDGRETVSVQRSRIALLAGLATLAIRGAAPSAAWADPPPTATVYKSPT
jgi:hypothetical protein